MDIESLRDFCLSLPHTTEQIRWQDHLVFKVGGKMYAVAALEPIGNYVSLKTSPEDFVTLVERPGVIPAPYLARAHWIAVEQQDSLPASELKELLAGAHRLVLAALPKRTRTALSRRDPTRKSKRAPARIQRTARIR